MNEITVGIVALVVLLLLFSTGIEFGFAMALVGFAGFAYLKRHLLCHEPDRQGYL